MSKKVRMAEEKFDKAISLLNNEKDFSSEREALLLLEEAADLEHSEAMFKLANIFYNGTSNVLKNSQKAMCYFQKSYNMGIIDALPFLMEDAVNRNDVNTIIDNIDVLHNLSNSKNQYAAQVMCIIFKKYTNTELKITPAKRTLILKDISLCGYPLDKVPYLFIKNK